MRGPVLRGDRFRRRWSGRLSPREWRRRRDNRTDDERAVSGFAATSPSFVFLVLQVEEAKQTSGREQIVRFMGELGLSLSLPSPLLRVHAGVRVEFLRLIRFA